MPDLEDELKLQNWLSVLTFDVFKYVKAGGEVVAEWTPGGLLLRLVGIGPDTAGVNGRFLSIAATPQEPTP